MTRALRKVEGDDMPLAYDLKDIEWKMEYERKLVRIKDLLDEARLETLTLPNQEFFFLRMQLMQQAAMIEQMIGHVET